MVQGVKFVMDVYVLELAGVDVVLGVQWLAGLGNVISNYKSMTMSFLHEGQRVILSGSPLLEVSSLPSKTFRKLVDSDVATGLFTMHVRLETTSPVSEILPTVAPPLQDVLHTFVDVFAEPTHLPPRRQIDHRIELLPHAPPVNVRPYRYRHFQKAEMERLVEEMLKTGVIRDSRSPFFLTGASCQKERRIVAFLRRLSGFE